MTMADEDNLQQHDLLLELHFSTSRIEQKPK